ncbi:MAG: 5-formyltetrahydrofolate cyclo-ligase [Colwellia sp.]
MGVLGTHLYFRLSAKMTEPLLITTGPNNTPHTEPNTRTSIRQTLRTKRKTLTTAFQIEASESLKLRLLNHPRVQSAKKIALYLANDGELDPMSFINWCWQQGKQVYLPVLHPFCPGHLLFLLFEKTSFMVKNQYGINEPKLDVTKVCPLEQLDVLCTPLVAFDCSGARLGMGGGFYDRTLVNWQKNQLYPIGIAHDCQQIDQVPVEYWDIPLPEIITPTQNHQF